MCTNFHLLGSEHVNKDELSVLHCSCHRAVELDHCKHLVLVDQQCATEDGLAKESAHQTLAVCIPALMILPQPRRKVPPCTVNVYSQPALYQ